MKGELFLKRAALPLLAILLVTGVTLFLLAPRFKKISLIFRENQNLIKERRDFLQKAQLIASLDENKLRENALLATLALPKEKEISLILYALNEPARNNNFYLEEMEFRLGEIGSASEKKTSETTKKTLIEQIPVKITLLGPEKKLFSLLLEMEKTLPLIEIKKLEGRVTPDGRAMLKLSLSLFLSPQRAVYDPEKVAISDLTLSPEEEKLLVRLREFKKSPLVMELFGGTTTLPPVVGRENPFSLGQ